MRRRRAAALACFDSARFEALARGSRFRARLVARLRLREPLRGFRRPWPVA
ncbi:MAG TPA: hypothetical protein VMR50_15845 [Myxococcota bacterium]|nr:hypothetical protein [Myxococcota bacterium]